MPYKSNSTAADVKWVMIMDGNCDGGGPRSV